MMHSVCRTQLKRNILFVSIAVILVCGIIALYAWAPAVTLIAIYLILRFVYHYDQIADEVISTLNVRRNGGK